MYRLAIYYDAYGGPHLRFSLGSSYADGIFEEASIRHELRKEVIFKIINELIRRGIIELYDIHSYNSIDFHVHNYDIVKKAVQVMSYLDMRYKGSRINCRKYIDGEITFEQFIETMYKYTTTLRISQNI